MSVISEVAEYLSGVGGIGVIGDSIFYGQMPDQDKDFLICVYDRTGLKPSVDIVDIKSPMIQIMVRAKDYDTGKTKLDLIRSRLHGKINVYLQPGGIYFRRIQANSEGGHIGVNEDNNKDEFSINFMAEVIE